MFIGERNGIYNMSLRLSCTAKGFIVGGKYLFYSRFFFVLMCVVWFNIDMTRLNVFTDFFLSILVGIRVIPVIRLYSQFVIVNLFGKEKYLAILVIGSMIAFLSIDLFDLCCQKCFILCA
jgi:hypothetical protein